MGEIAKTRNAIIVKRRDALQQIVGQRVVERKVRGQREEKELERKIGHIRLKMSI